MKENIKDLQLLIATHQKRTDLVQKRMVVLARYRYTTLLDKIREYCDNLYDALSDTWNCSCHHSPSVMLKLETQQKLCERLLEVACFSLLLTFRTEASLNGANKETWRYREAKVTVAVARELIPKRPFLMGA